MKPQWDMMFWQNQGQNVEFAVDPTRWYCIEAHVRVNDLGQSNGVIEAWVTMCWSCDTPAWTLTRG
jgi:hypothetical protein